ncbi:DUF1304 domain-containing protein [Bdellovibrio bacteriovorus]
MIAENVFAGLVALLHFYFLYLEMFLWTKPQGLKIFRNTLQKAEDSRILAANQGLYNGFLAAGLVWSIIHPDPYFAFQIRVFFYTCVIVAGVYGALTANKKIFFVQALPAILGLILSLTLG